MLWAAQALVEEEWTNHVLGLLGFKNGCRSVKHIRLRVFGRESNFIHEFVNILNQHLNDGI